MAFADLINRKYQILGQTAQSESDLRAAQAGQIRGATALAPGEAAAREAQAFGTAGAETGLGGYYSALGGATTARVPSEVGLAGAQSEQARAQAAESTARTSAIPGITDWLKGTSIDNNSGGNFAMGTDRVNAMNGKTSVPGKMPPQGQNTDVTPANLTPGEAVLNRGAAEHLGRDVIDVLNAIGNIKMQGDKGAVSTPGPVTKAPTDSENGVKGYRMGGVPGYAQGTGDIGSRIGGMPGPGGGYWGPNGDTPPAPGSNTGIRNSVPGMGGVPRPAPASGPAKPAPSIMGYADGMSDIPEPGAAVGYADGTSEVMARTHADAARNSQAGEVGNDRKAMVKGGKPTDSNAGEDSTKSYAKGTAKVPGKGAKKPAAGASKITPEMLQQLMSLSKGGGGMIPPGQGAPMPMPMPQVAPGGGMGP